MAHTMRERNSRETTLRWHIYCKNTCVPVSSRTVGLSQNKLVSQKKEAVMRAYFILYQVRGSGPRPSPAPVLWEPRTPFMF